MQIVALEVERRNELAGDVAIFPDIALARPLQALTGGDIHAELQDAQPAVQHVVGVFLALENRLQQRLALIQPLADPPFLEADETDPRLRRAARLQLRQINPAPPLDQGTLLGEGFGDAPDIDAVEGAVFPDEVEDETSDRRVAQALELLVGRIALGFVEEWIRNEFTLLEPPAGQPFDVHEELRAEVAQDVLGDGLVAPRQERAEHPAAPDLHLRIVLQKVRFDGAAEPAQQLPVGLLPFRPGEAREVGFLETGGAKPRRVRREKIDFRIAVPVLPGAVNRDLPQLPRQTFVLEPPERGERAAGEIAGAGVSIEEIHR